MQDQATCDAAMKLIGAFKEKIAHIFYFFKGLLRSKFYSNSQWATQRQFN